MMKADVVIICFADGQRDHEARNLVASRRQKRQERLI